MPATPLQYTPDPWLFDEQGDRIVYETEEEYLELMNAYMAEQYAGLSHPIIGDAIYDLPDPVWALRNLIQEDGLTILHGQPGSFKSFIAMDWAYSLASPQSSGWMGQPRAKQFKPMYLFTEGIAGLKNRSIAWSKERGMTTPSMDDAVIWVRDRVGLNSVADPANPFTQQVASLVKMYNDYHCNILFIDTLANTFVGNENMQQDANSYLRTLSLFQAGGPVVLIHHNKKGEDEFRGSTVFHGAVDTLVSMKKTGEGMAKLSISKQKDGPENFYLDLKAVKHAWEGDYKQQDSIALATDRPDPWTLQVYVDILRALDKPRTVKEVSDRVMETPQTTKSRLDRMVEGGKLRIVDDVKPTTYTVNQPEEI